MFMHFCMVFKKSFFLDLTGSLDVFCDILVALALSFKAVVEDQLLMF